MKNFFKHRLQLHQKQMLKYLRYVFNDHFVLICTFLLGGLGLYYSDFLKTLPRGMWQAELVVVLLLVASLQIGRLASLAKPADMVFLLPKEKEMQDYLGQALLYSCWFPFACLFLLAGIAMPLYVVATGQPFSQFFVLVLLLWLLKFAHLIYQRFTLFHESREKKTSVYLLWLALSVLAISVAIFVAPLIGLGIALVVTLLFWQLLWQRPQLTLDWEKMVALEQDRLHRLYQFINLFTDVPEITATVKRRKYLDIFLQKIPYQQSNTYLYLYARRMLRGSEYSGLYFRLLVIGSLVLVFIDQLWISLVLGILFIYLIGFQLVPLYSQFQYMVLTHLYPIAEEQKQRALQKLLTILLVVVAVIFTLIAGFQMTTWSQRGILLVGFIGIALAFCYLYLPLRVKKLVE